VALDAAPLGAGRSYVAVPICSAGWVTNARQLQVMRRRSMSGGCAKSWARRWCARWRMGAGPGAPVVRRRVSWLVFPVLRRSSKSGDLRD